MVIKYSPLHVAKSKRRWKKPPAKENNGCNVKNKEILTSIGKSEGND